MGGLIFAAPASGSGKTTITLGFLRAVSRNQTPIRSAKSGPDYIDPRFHAAASGAACINLDAWAMTPDRLRSLAHHENLQTMLIEGAMGLFDGAPPDGKGSTADLAKALGVPVVLVVDAGRMAGSIAPLVRGFMSHDRAVTVAGVILNNVGSPRHELMLRRALAPYDIRIFGAVPRDAGLAHPSRHLGLMQADERSDLEAFLNHAADIMDHHLDMQGLLELSAKHHIQSGVTRRMHPPAQVIAVAQDRAFGFCYPHLLNDWRSQGAEIRPFSPLANDSVPAADLVYLPGGYPELYAGQIAANLQFVQSLQSAAQISDIYGECGGYMVLGDVMIDADGHHHNMAGLLRLGTSFATRKLHLGYRDIHALNGPFTGAWKAHEFHYATTTHATGDPLFTAKDAQGDAVADMGLIHNRVSGSFAHIIDAA